MKPSISASRCAPFSRSLLLVLMLAPARAALAGEPGAAWSRSATAFAVRGDGVFLAVGHVAQDCPQLELEDGSALDVLRAD